ncbi:MAG: hypothetical protein H6Q80_1375 [Deltaproteobacteria bacterium]|nr:hypothetical protein [Deltaproteobacteria bacterium]
MNGALVVLVLLLAVVAAFGLQNPGEYTVRFLHLSWVTSMLGVIVAAFAAGVLGGWITGVPGYFRRRSEASAAKKRIQELEIEVAALKAKSAPPAGPAAEGKA